MHFGRTRSNLQSRHWNVPIGLFWFVNLDDQTRVHRTYVLACGSGDDRCGMPIGDAFQNLEWKTFLWLQWNQIAFLDFSICRAKCPNLHFYFPLPNAPCRQCALAKVPKFVVHEFFWRAKFDKISTRCRLQISRRPIREPFWNINLNN